MPTDSSSQTPVRRPRMTPDREVELLNTALEVLREVGYEAMTMDAVATRGRCSKATLYRQWRSKPEMIAAALYVTRPVSVESIDTGSLRGDLMTLATQISEGSRKDTQIFAALSHACLVDQDLVRALREALIDPEVTHLTRIVERAVERGELAEWPAAAVFLPSLLLGVTTTRPILDGTYADADYMTRFIDHVLLPALTHS
ncbi:TetR/AcrR family transcriptional regulator [Streptomyces sp. bgisy027]|uniref:TetR/AcrR family transcriptional regulator n=1 Tax=unclassified Streptomyces TaxID=2593676 RepID=UPI003D7158BF